MVRRTVAGLLSFVRQSHYDQLSWRSAVQHSHEYPSVRTYGGTASEPASRQNFVVDKGR